MPPKIDPNQIFEVTLKIVGGETTGASTLGPKLGPYGVAPKKVGEDILKLTQDYKGYKVTVSLRIQNRQATVAIVPTAPARVLKALKEPPRDRKKVKNIKHNGNLTLDQIIEVAKVLRPKSQSRLFAGTVCEILGTCLSVGCSVEGTSPKIITQKIKSGEIAIQEVA